MHSDGRRFRGRFEAALLGIGRCVVFGNFVEDVGELSGIEDLAAELADNELGVLLAGDDANLRMFARCWHAVEKLWVGKKFAFAPVACQP